MAPANVGVDFGSTSLRAAYAPPDEPARFVELPDGQWPWLLHEPPRREAPARGFPGLKSRLGIAPTVRVDGRELSPQVVVTGALEYVRQQVEAETSAAIGQVVISVPARYPSSQRAALRDAAHAAGLTEVRLASDSLAAVIGHGARSATVLVYAVGYAGFELGLVRAAGGTYRALGYEGRESPAGATIDAEVLGAWTSEVDRNHKLPTAGTLADDQWLSLRVAAQLVKEQLGAHDRVTFPSRVAAQVALGLQFRRHDFESWLRNVVSVIAERADALLDQCRLTAADVDEVLLVGGTTRLRPVRDVAEQLGGRTVATPPDHLARGALAYAERLAGLPALTHEEPPVLGDDTDQPTPAAVPSLTPVVLRAPDLGGRVPAAAGPEPTEAHAPDLAAARRLARSGHGDQATAVLHELIAEAQALLDEVAGAGPGSATGTGSGTGAGAGSATGTGSGAATGSGSGSATGAGAPPEEPAPTRRMAQAQELLALGRYDEAVGMSHLAWQEAPTSPRAFEDMIDVHCRAALAVPTVERFDDAERWLRCAYTHDQSNAQVREILAERTYAHADALHELGRREEATTALHQCLKWDPEHRAGQELLGRLQRQPSIQPPPGRLPADDGQPAPPPASGRQSRP